MTPPQHITSRVAVEAASAPSTLLTGAGATVTGLGEWAVTGPGLATIFGLALTAATFAINAWSIVREDRRKQQRHEIELLRAAKGE